MIQMPDTTTPLGGILVLVVFVYLLVFYFLPWIIANQRNVVHLNKIVAINFFYGWTGLGWLLAGIWALTDEPFSDESEEEVVEPTDDVNGNPRVEPEW